MDRNETIAWMKRHAEASPLFAEWLAGYHPEAKRGKVEAWTRDLAGVSYDSACQYTDECLDGTATHPRKGEYDRLPEFVKCHAEGIDASWSAQKRELHSWGEKHDWSGAPSLAQLYREDMARKQREREQGVEVAAPVYPSQGTPFDPTAMR